MNRRALVEYDLTNALFDQGATIEGKMRDHEN